jgi:hypothetical protein
LVKSVLNALCDDALTPAQAATVNAARREFHASNAMAGMYAGITVPGANSLDGANIAAAAVRAADFLIAELDKPQT